MSDVTNSYVWNAESEIKIAGGLNYSYDGDGDRVQKSNGKIYWYGAGSQILDESDAAGNITDEYVYFGGKRVAHRVVTGNVITYYAEDMLGSSRAIGTSTGAPCYDADFYPYGGEHDYLNTCPQNYKFTGKERDPETNNDDFDARYYASAYGRFLSADWSSTPAPVPYANLTNPQTLNLYAMVSDNPESFGDANGHFRLVSSCGSNTDCQKKYEKDVTNFTKALEADLKSKDPNVRAAAKAFGALGENNGVEVGFANVASQNIKGEVDPFSSGPANPVIQVTFDSSLTGTSLQESIAHEGTHVADDVKFVDSYSFITFKYDSGANPTHEQTEINAYRAAARVDQEHGFGPKDTAKIRHFVESDDHYKNILNQRVFPATDFPQ